MALYSKSHTIRTGSYEFEAIRMLKTCPQPSGLKIGSNHSFQSRTKYMRSLWQTLHYNERRVPPDMALHAVMPREVIVVRDEGN